MILVFYLPNFKDLNSKLNPVKGLYYNEKFPREFYFYYNEELPREFFTIFSIMKKSKGSFVYSFILESRVVQIIRHTYIKYHMYHSR